MKLKHAAVASAMLILTGCATTPLPQPIAPYQARNLDILQPQNDGNVLGRADVSATHGTSKVDEVTICVANEDGQRFDFTPYLNIRRTMTQAWIPIVETQHLPAGEYTYWACVFDAGREQQVTGPTQSFTVQ